MALIRQLKSFLAKTNIYPKTLTSAVYDNEGNRLDNKLGAASLSGYADGTITGAVKSACDDVETLKSDVNQINSNFNKIGNEIVNISKVGSGIEFVGMYIKVGNVVTISASVNIYTNIDNTNQLIDDPIPIPHERCDLLVVKHESIPTLQSARIANGLIYPNFTMTPGEYSLNGSYICNN